MLKTLLGKPDMDSFQAFFGDLSTPFCLCSGLAILSSNKAFQDLFPEQPTGRDAFLLSKNITRHESLERLYSYPGHPVEVAIPDSNSKHLEVSARPWTNNHRLWLLEWRDLTPEAELKSKLQTARMIDTSSGALLPNAFTAVLAKELERLDRTEQGGFLAYLSFVTPTGSAALPRTRCDELISTVVDEIRNEFGTQTLISRNDTLSLTALIETLRDGSEAPYAARQLRRISTVVAELENLQIEVAGASYPSNATNVVKLSEAAGLAAANSDFETVSLFDPTMLEDYLRRRQLAADMAAALKSNDITPHFQPVIDAANGHIKGFEALVRWEHPELGRVFPPDIISIAQENNQLHDLTAHILKQTVAQTSLWPDHVQFAVNITPSQLASPLVDLVREVVRESDIDPARLEIEVTEEALIDDFEWSANIFARLRAIGVAIAMDDFGAGYTSVGNLRKLNFSKIKIDKCISDGLPHDRKSIAIVKSLMFMARELDVDITVEGIETEEQLEFLRAFNCGVQGYVFSPALPASALPEMQKFVAPGMKTQKGRPVVGIGPRNPGKAKAQRKNIVKNGHALTK